MVRNWLAWSNEERESIELASTGMQAGPLPNGGIGGARPLANGLYGELGLRKRHYCAGDDWLSGGGFALVGFLE